MNFMRGEFKLIKTLMRISNIEYRTKKPKNRHMCSERYRVIVQQIMSEVHHCLNNIISVHIEYSAIKLLNCRNLQRKKPVLSHDVSLNPPLASCRLGVGFLALLFLFPLQEADLGWFWVGVGYLYSFLAIQDRKRMHYIRERSGS